MIGSLIRPEAGSVTIDGANVVRERSKALSQLGMLHDDFGLYPRLTVVGEMVVDEVINMLSRTAELRVISRLSTNQIRPCRLRMTPACSTPSTEVFLALASVAHQKKKHLAS